MACCGDMGFPVVHQPGELRAILARAGKTRPFAVVYQPQSGDVVEHFEHVGWMCIAATNCVLMADEIDQVCSAGSPKNAQSGYWKRAAKGPALDHLVNYGRHCHVACIFIARAPQDVWRRLTGSSSRCIVFRMNERLEMEAVQGRLGEEWTRQLPGLAKYEYVDWYDDGEVSKRGGKV